MNGIWLILSIFVKAKMIKLIVIKIKINPLMIKKVQSPLTIIY